jgi:hypothetical protein
MDVCQGRKGRTGSFSFGSKEVKILSKNIRPLYRMGGDIRELSRNDIIECINNKQGGYFS